MNSSRNGFVIAIIVVIFLSGIPQTHGSRSVLENMDYWPTYEWRSSTPESQGMDSEVLESMIDHYNQDSINVDSLIVIRNGYIVLEEYFSEDNLNDTHHIYSCTKTITSTLIGIASSMGYIESTDLSIINILSDYIHTEYEEKKQQINIEHLLTMSTGLDWEEDYSRNSINDYHKMIRSENWVEYVLNKSMIETPHSSFQYNSGASHLLSAILQISTGNTSLEFAMEYLFKPLGIMKLEWETDPLGIYRGESMMQLIPRDMAKIGLLYLMNGVWEDERIISSNWVNSSVNEHIEVDETRSYGYQWWILPAYGAYYALGWGQQFILILPDYDIVTVMTARSTDVSTQIGMILTKWILPALGIPITTSISFQFNLITIVIVACPIGLLGIVLIMERLGLWIESDP